MEEPTRHTKPVLSNEASAPLAQIEAALARSIDDRVFEGSLGPAMRHALLGGGKRIRPLLAWHACVAVGGEGERALPACLAIEMVHAFSLVHDDLPAMDDDDLRRGKPTVHIAFGEACAILAGDALLNLAQEVLSDNELEPVRAIACSGVLSAATRSMINGQMLDMQGEPQGHPEPSLEEVRRLHEAKTGALISAACEMGGICGGASDQTRVDLRTFGLTLGLLFQATDDLIDVEQSSEHAGKRTGKDERAGKRTLVGILGIDRARQEVVRLEAECDRLLGSIEGQADVLREFSAMIARRTR